MLQKSWRGSLPHVHIYFIVNCNVIVAQRLAEVTAAGINNAMHTQEGYLSTR